jgi:cytochrome b6-f complex subunit 5
LDLDNFEFIIKLCYSIIVFKAVFTFINLKKIKMVEPLLSGIVLGMITVSALGLFVAAFLQYRRGNQFEV